MDTLSFSNDVEDTNYNKNHYLPGEDNKIKSSVGICVINQSTSIYIITWNVATRTPDENLQTLLNISRDNKSLPDFYIIGLQEVKSQPQNFVLDTIFRDPWTAAFRDTLAPYDYVKVKTARLVGLLLNVFCLRKHVVHVRNIHAEYTKTGILGLWGNKGAVTVRLQIYGCSLCFVNSHLAPHDGMVKERIDDYNSILQGQKFDIGDTTTILFHDYVFWFGDLNFRLTNELQLPSSKIINMIKEGNISALLRYDQLRQVMASGEAFSELTEDIPKFSPTYRFNLNSSEYDSKRRPAWTDRILYRVNKNVYEDTTLDITQVNYTSYEQYSISDHKPVTSELIVKVFSSYSEKKLQINPVGTWYVGVENKLMVKMDEDMKPSIWDWIGIYQENFAGLDEYIHYIYLPSPKNTNNNIDNDTNSVSVSDASEAVEDEDQQICSVTGCNNLRNKENVYFLTFSDTAITRPGSYKLLYITQDFESVFGISDSFNIVQVSANCKATMDW